MTNDKTVMTKWQPIETAPTNNVRVLLYVPPYGVTTGNCNEDINGNIRWNMHAVLNKQAMPTHWIPLPEPPKE